MSNVESCSACNSYNPDSVCNRSDCPRVFLFVELVKSDQMRFKMKGGNPVLFAQMMRNAMLARPDIAAALIASVCDYADHMGIPRSQIGNMVKFLGR